MPRMMQPRRGQYFVYMVRCTNGAYCTGSTNNLEARIKLHSSGHGVKYLRGNGPVRLVYAKAYRYYKRAVQGEGRLKKRSRREKEALIRAYERLAPKISSPVAPKSRPGASRTFG